MPFILQIILYLLRICSVIPTHYVIFLRYLTRSENKFAYTGEATIELNIRSSTKDITLNTTELKISSAELITENDITQKAFINYQTEIQRTVFSFGNEVNGGKAKLLIQFVGNINNVRLMKVENIATSINNLN